MKFVQMPNFKDTWGKITLKTLSLSTFSCIYKGFGYKVFLLKELSFSGNKACQLPSYINNMFGSIINIVYELASKDQISIFDEMIKKWEQLVHELDNLLEANYPTLQNSNDYDKINKIIRYAILINKKTL